jgi:hypothetical protein
MEKMRRAAADLTGRDCEILAELVRAAKTAAASINADDYETLAGYRVYRGNLHRYYGMVSGMVEDILQEKKDAEYWQEVAGLEPGDFGEIQF